MEDRETLSPAEREIAIRHDCQTLQSELRDLLRQVQQKGVLLDYLYAQLASIEQYGAEAFFSGVAAGQQQKS